MIQRLTQVLGILLVSCTGYGQNLITPFERSAGTATATYQEGISWWKALAATYPGKIRMMTLGLTDSGEPLRLVVLSPGGNFNFNSLHSTGHCILLINNAIHPGEPDGVDASMILARDLAQGKLSLPPKVVLAIIPFYNIGGVLNRGSFSRASQNGPVAYGFRGNAQNLDLNRDFIKCDSRNARSFARIFHLVNPDLFIDTHVSDGADYQHVMTLLTTQHDKLGPILGP
ncbi:MAG TPA: M14 family zinc carboxypeptidase, partial [Chitinophagaceae bacterium]|nr:M14 family zinc carboxypeptidase [Chitinophagaceae bacterium]